MAGLTPAVATAHHVQDNLDMTNRPNILVFCTDQQRADHLGFLGTTALQTPHIDAIAAAGTHFTSCYTSCPACMPARQTLFTGRTNRAQGVRQNGNPLPRHIPVLPALLRDAGYRTHAVGKLHLRCGLTPPGLDLASEDPTDEPERHAHWQAGRIRRAPDGYYGFDRWDATLGHSQFVHGAYRVWLEANHPETAEILDRPMPRTERYPWWELPIDPAHHWNTWIADRSIDFLEQADDDRPFFLWCSFPDPHSPYTGLPDYTAAYRDADIPLPAHDQAIDLATIPRTIIQLCGGIDGFRATVHRHGGENLRHLYIQTFGMIAHIDQQIGRVMAALRDHGHDQTTLVIFLSDHGEQLGEHGLMHKNHWPYDGCCRVPLIIRPPAADGPAARRTVNRPVGFIDFAPTLLDYAGVQPPDDPLANDTFFDLAGPVQPVLPGESLRPVVDTGAEPVRGTALIEFDDDLNPHAPCVQMRVLVTDTHKLCYYRPTGECLLYDRRHDPGEQRNLYHDPAHADLARTMLERLLDQCLHTEPRLPRRVIGS